MGIRPHPELHPACRQFARQLPGVDGSAPGDQPGKLRLGVREQLVAQLGPDPVGPNQRQRGFLLPRHPPALPHGDALGVGRGVLELPAEPQLDVRIVVDLRQQRRLQIGAMDDPIGRPGAKCSGIAERQAGDFTAALRAHDADGIGHGGAGTEPRPKSEIDQHPAGIGRQLQAGAGLLESLHLFQNDDAKALSRQRKGCRQSSDPGPGNDDRAGCGHGPVIRRLCPSPRIRAAGLRRQRGRRHSDTASSNTDR